MRLGMLKFLRFITEKPGFELGKDVFVSRLQKSITLDFQGSQDFYCKRNAIPKHPLLGHYWGTRWGVHWGIKHYLYHSVFKVNSELGRICWEDKVEYRA